MLLPVLPSILNVKWHKSSASVLKCLAWLIQVAKLWSCMRTPHQVPQWPWCGEGGPQRLRDWPPQPEDWRPRTFWGRARTREVEGKPKPSIQQKICSFCQYSLSCKSLALTEIRFCSFLTRGILFSKKYPYHIPPKYRKYTFSTLPFYSTTVFPFSTNSVTKCYHKLLPHKTPLEILYP